ncbi:hypothetical protein J6X15_00435 [Candidatus Saccharibacteria bacterium]|nr:hypothetical protein [Candidatus Saccharibacteria bacterium]
MKLRTIIVLLILTLLCGCYDAKSGLSTNYPASTPINVDFIDIQIDSVPEPKDPCFWGCPPYRPHGNPDDFGGGTLSEEDSDFDIVPEEYIPPEPPSASQ